MADHDDLSFTDAPTGSESRQLAALASELARKSADVARLERELEAAKRRRHELQHREIPEYMLKIGQDRIGLPHYSADVELAPFYYANIAADWDEERRARAFAALEAAGGGDLIRVVVSYTFRKEQLEDARWLVAAVAEATRQAGIDGVDVDVPEPATATSVPWNTLTAFVRECVEGGKVLDLEALGAQVGYVAKLKKRS